MSNEFLEIIKRFESKSYVAATLIRNEISDDMLAKNHIDYLSVSKSDNTKITYLTKDRIDKIDPNDYWSSSKRYLTKPGAFVSKLFNRNISSRDVEEFSNLFNSFAVVKPLNFRVVEGEDIRKYYKYSNYAEERGSLGNSCMKYENCQGLFNIYTENTDHIKMLILLNDSDRIMGRALLWNFDNKVMDRIYTISDEEYAAHFKKWADDNGYIYKTEQNWGNTINFNVGGENKELKLSFKLPNTSMSKYPYMDTFKFLDDNGVIHNHIPDTKDFRTLCGADGSTYNSDYFRFDAISRTMRHSGECVYVSYKDFYTYSGNTYYSSINDAYIMRSDSVYSNELEDYIFNSDFSKFNNDVKIADYINRRKAKVEKIKFTFDSDSFGGWDSDRFYRRNVHPITTTDIIQPIEMTDAPTEMEVEQVPQSSELGVSYITEHDSREDDSNFSDLAQAVSEMREDNSLSADDVFETYTSLASTDGRRNYLNRIIREMSQNF